jgi:hypothetical protein
MRGVVITWAIGEGIIVARSIRRQQPPLPSQLLATSGLFVMLALLGEAAPGLATMLGVGVDVAAFLQLFPAPAPAPAPAAATGSTQAA